MNKRQSEKRALGGSISRAFGALGQTMNSRAIGGTITRAFNALGQAAQDASENVDSYDFGWNGLTVDKKSIKPKTVQSRFLGGMADGLGMSGFTNLLGMNKPAPPPKGSTWMEKIGSALTAPMDEGTFNTYKGAMETSLKHLFPAKQPLNLKRGGKVQKKFFGGLMKRAGDFWDSLTSSSHIPKTFRNQMEKHKDEPIESIVMYRSPLDRLTTFVADAITAGNFAEIKQKAGMDKLYHTGIIINGKYQIEKLESPSFKNAKPMLSDSDTETYDIDLKGKSITIGDFIEAGAKKMGAKDFAGYSFKDNNCQYFVKSLLEGNGLLTADAKKWVFQDIEKLVEETPSFSKYLMDAVTDTARTLGNAFDAAVNKRGGRVRQLH